MCLYIYTSTILIAGGVVGYLLINGNDEEESGKSKDNDKKKPTQTEEKVKENTIDYSDKNSYSDTYYATVCPAQFGNYNCATSKKRYESNASDSKIYGTYKCEADGCYAFSATENYMTVYDNDEYFIYDNKTSKNVKTLNIEKIRYNDIKITYNSQGSVTGVIVVNEDNEQAFYDTKKQEYVINYGEFKEIINSTIDGYVFVSNGSISLYDLNKKEVVCEKCQRGICKNNIYFADGSNIYDKDMNVVASNVSEYGSCLYVIDKTIYSNTDGIINVENAKSQEVDGILTIVSDYAYVLDNGNLKILDSNLNVKADFGNVSYVDYNYENSYYSFRGICDTYKKENEICWAYPSSTASDDNETPKLNESLTQVNSYYYFYDTVTGNNRKLRGMITQLQ